MAERQTLWIFRHAVLVSVADRAAANQAAVDLLPEGESERKTFQPNVRPKGSAPGTPATHCFAFLSTTENIRGRLAQAFANNRVASADFLRMDAKTGKLQNKGKPSPKRAEGTVMDLDAILDEFGVEFVPRDIDGKAL